MEKLKPNIQNRMKIIDRILKHYQLKKQLLKTEAEKQKLNQMEKVYYEDLKDRMNQGYKKLKRQKKINKLQKLEKHWRGLE